MPSFGGRSAKLPNGHGEQPKYSAPHCPALSLSKMSQPPQPAPSGRVETLHLHPLESGLPLRSVAAFEVVPDKGIAGNGRYFGRRSRSTGKPSRRQVSLIEREQVAEHAASLGLESIPPG